MYKNMYILNIHHNSIFIDTFLFRQALHSATGLLLVNSPIYTFVI